MLSAFGSPVVAGQFGTFVPIAAEATAGGYAVAWKATDSESYTVLNADASGVFQSHAFFVVRGSSLALQSAETTLQQDLNGDGHLGVVTVTIETAGTTSLVQRADTFFLFASGTTTGPSLKIGSATVTDGQFGGGWAPVAAAASGGGYQVAWKMGSADSYAVWNVDAAGTYLSNAVSVVSGGSAGLQASEVTFGQDLNGDGIVGLHTTVIETAGGTSLTKGGDGFFLFAGGTTAGPALKFTGAAVTEGQFGSGWTPIGAEATAGGYRVAWKMGAADSYAVWSVDGKGNYLANVSGLVSGGSAALQQSEAVLGQDLNGDGIVGLHTTAIETVGGTSLMKGGDGYFLFAGGTTTGPALKFAGVAVTEGQFGSGWTPIGAEASAGGYLVAWKMGTADSYAVWSVDASGNYLANVSGLVGAGSAALQQSEAVLGQDLNIDGTIGLHTTVIETVGGTSLTKGGDGYFLFASGAMTGPALKFAGTAVTEGQFGSGWTPIGAEATAGGYLVAWKMGTADSYAVWSVDATGNYLANVSGLVAGGLAALQQSETVLGQDLNGDGIVGLHTTAIEAVGGTSLVKGGDGYFLFTSGTTTGPALKFSAAAVTEGQFGSGWTPIGVEAVAGGYRVAWKLAGLDTYTVWSVDGAGNYLSNVIGLVSGGNASLKALEALFGQDLNGDGTVGPV